ncbi:MAG: esterase-like activity of phytase family protein [Candidatus Cloacimonetes bacterium]|nr:esterase-like activity of phytase family protein [Candidatus Cloacimonadota bacterium]
MIRLFLMIWFHGALAGDVHNLSLKKLWSVDTQKIALRMDLSGLTSDGVSLYTVSDLSHLNDIYRIDFEEDRAVLKVAVKLSEDWMQGYAQKNASYGRLDMEGIAFCDGKFFIVNEHKRSILVVDQKEPHPTEIVPDWEKFHQGRMNPFSGVLNAGLEGIACHSEGLYLLNERQFRMGYVYSFKDRKLTQQFDVAAGKGLPHYLGNETWKYQDFAGADFYEGHLYLLERNSHQIIKVDPANYQVLARYDFSQWEKGLFESEDPFGLAEGLAIQNGSFFVILDNNLDLRSSDKSPMPYLLELTI